MLAKDLVIDYVPVITGSDTFDQVIDQMVLFKVGHLPMVVEDQYRGLISEKDIKDLTGKDQTIGSRTLDLLLVSITENQHVYEVIDLIARYDLSVLPVLGSDSEYLGSITLPSLVKTFNILTAAGQPGAILVFNLAMQDYSPTLLSRIIEDNNAKIMSLYTVPDPNGRELLVTIKVNTQEISSMMRSFDRFGYQVKSHYMASSQLDDFYRSRYEEFMNYMNI
jgi:CBS domain-containing protein